MPYKFSRSFQKSLYFIGILFITCLVLSPKAHAEYTLDKPSFVLAQAQSEDLELGQEYKSHSKKSSSENNKDSHSVVSKILLYIPNRVFDLLDIFRLRVRVGPGLDAGIRVTEPLSLYVGGHTAIYAGLPGPRQKRTIPLPVGLESSSGARASVLDASISADTESRHSFTEIGVETQLLLVGVDIAVDPVEVLDFITGFFFIEIREDDLGF